MKKVRHVDNEYVLARKAARSFKAMTPPDIESWQIAAYEHGYAQALMDVADGLAKAPKPDWRDS